jgi:RNA polymerase sigma-70 factor (ECF subfamily)
MQNGAASIPETLTLVNACLNGDETAWNTFIARYRPVLYSAALAIAKDGCLARELADSLWADLYGTRTDGNGRRISKLATYIGRGSLEGWLRTLLAQEFIDRHRKQRRLLPLDDNAPLLIDDPDRFTELADPRLNLAFQKALAELKGEDRLILATHYLDARNLAEIGRMLGLHESTISRRVSKSTRSLRKRTIHHLRKSGIGTKEAAELIAADAGQIAINLRDHLLPLKDAL